MAARPDKSNDLVVPFIFVPKGCPAPREWLAAHPGAVRFPAQMKCSGTAAPTEGDPHPFDQAASSEN